MDFRMRFWSQNGPQNGSQNRHKSIQNRSKTASVLKNLDFWKIAPRLHETLMFEDSWCPKRFQNPRKTLQEPNKNTNKNSIEFWTDFLLILDPSWLPEWLQNDSKNDSKNVSKNKSKNHWKMEPKWSPKWSQNPGFLLTFWGPAPRSPPGRPKWSPRGAKRLRKLIQKGDPKGFKME